MSRPEHETDPDDTPKDETETVRPGHDETEEESTLSPGGVADEGLPTDPQHPTG